MILLPQRQLQRDPRRDLAVRGAARLVDHAHPQRQVGQLLGAVKPAGDIAATAWVGRADRYLRRATLKGPLVEAGKNVQVEIDFRDFNQPVTITKPV